jgi:hypothetical protein
MKDLSTIVGELQGLVDAAVEDRDQIQRQGFNVLRANFYASTPSIAEIRDSFEYKEPTPYLHPDLFDHDRLTSVLHELLAFAGDLDAPMDDDSEQPTGFFWNNSQFSYSDAAAYYAFIRLTKPKRIVEVGAGFSTLIASAAIEANGRGEVLCIEPYPRPFLRGIRHVTEVVEQPVQSLGADWFNDVLGDNDLLFIDSTHTVKLGSDCLHIYLRVLPAIRHKLLVHIHDVFLPEAMPRDWALNHQLFWTEQYLLMAYLLDNPKTKVVFGSNYHRILNPEILRKMTPPALAFGGSSFWFRLDPGAGAPDGPRDE